MDGAVSSSVFKSHSRICRRVLDCKRQLPGLSMLGGGTTQAVVSHADDHIVHVKIVLHLYVVTRGDLRRNLQIESRNLLLTAVSSVRVFEPRQRLETIAVHISRCAQWRDSLRAVRTFEINRRRGLLQDFAFH